MRLPRKIIPFLILIIIMAVNISLVQADDTDPASVVVSDTIEYGTVTTSISDTTVSVSAEADEGYCLLDLRVVMPDGTKKVFRLSDGLPCRILARQSFMPLLE